ncbi:FGGY-family carbohydrate kinase [Gracilibacillus alcaliphilus]|uniref:FGGY-family carbohydrate kinase n=1 Tax=Gracilibacillus alcaliphilus TaxID=1401441 RepID=UPI00195D7392|nr:FGGY family carbohydrate kinase [Gracilibacillus alcaliphilus]MBM7677557.1 xylulokinase [Gracilibacillus alcaliphilus]
MMSLLGIDIGTTNLKAGLFNQAGRLIDVKTTPHQVHYDEHSFPYYDPEALIESVMGLIEELQNHNSHPVEAIGITSMAESGLLVNQRTGKFISPILPWFDRRTDQVASQLSEKIDELERFKKTGIKHTYKHGIAKIVWLKEAGYQVGQDVKWLSAADLLAFHLTKEVATDYTLAARTYAYRIDIKEWDRSFIRECGLDEELFPEVKASYQPIGSVVAGFEHRGIKEGVPVVIAGHDHVCAALAVGAVTPDIALDSIGTAETLVGSVPERAITEADYHSGFNYGVHVLPNRLFWMGALQSSGGSIEWFRHLLADDKLTYEELLSLLGQSDNQPTGILYFPYITGSGAPQPDPAVNGALIGLKASHHKADIIKAVLEGLSYEFKWMKDTMESILSSPLDTIISVGGGTKNKYWMQLKANVLNCPIRIPDITEAALMGAAMLAGLAKGMYRDEEQMLDTLAYINKADIHPDVSVYKQYQAIYQNGYLRLQEPLRDLSQRNWL